MIAISSNIACRCRKGLPAAFGGIGEVIPGGKEIFRSDNLLPSIGGGPRFELSPNTTSICALTSPGAEVAGPGAWESERHFDAEQLSTDVKLKCFPQAPLSIRGRLLHVIDH